VAPGEHKYVEAEETAAFSARYDMIACCCGERVFPPMIFTPEDRTRLGVDGVRKFMVLKYIEDILAQAAGDLDLYPLVLVMDKSTAHNADEMLQMFHDNGCQDMQTIYYMPTNSAKRMSPLDNSLFHTWKEKCRKRGKIKKDTIVRIMSDCWNSINESTLRNYYRHCGLTYGRNVYFDCPDPSQHNHSPITRAISDRAIQI
jgi:MoaA/NifB/PqqE/SkfB family radical SAM enzyme